jgi:hypothetical protein
MCRATSVLVRPDGDATQLKCSTGCRLLQVCANLSLYGVAAVEREMTSALWIFPNAE